MNIIIYFILCMSFAFAQTDPDASQETKDLYLKLNNISLSINSQQQILIGHQNAFSEGRGWRYGNNQVGTELKSDMYEAVGVHPAVLGIDFSEIGEWNKDLIKYQFKKIHARGGVVTLSWHMNALVNDGKGDQSSKDKSTKVVHRILKGGDHHHILLKELDRLVTFLKEIKEIPIIFRPWHEHNFSWFWWGKRHCTRSEYVELWNLQDQGIHNLLYAYSPTQIKNDYLDRYPGDDYVDILGVDHYFYNKAIDLALLGLTPQKDYKEGIVWLCEEAVKRNKIPAITEFGQESSHYKRFWTDYFGWPLMKEGMEQILGIGKTPSKGPAYIMLWRNDINDPKHFYGPIPGHKNNQNFFELLSTQIFKGL